MDFCGWQAGGCHELKHDLGVHFAGHRIGLNGSGGPKYVLEGRYHGLPAGPIRAQQRPIDVKQNEFLHVTRLTSWFSWQLTVNQLPALL
jgi:hypothetical protein